MTYSKEEQIEKYLTSIFHELYGSPKWELDPNMRDTPKRVAKCWVNEIFAGLASPMPKITVFPNVEHYDEIITASFTEFSSCAHHILPFRMKVHIGYVPDKFYNGASKFARLVKWEARRPQIQERLVHNIAADLQNILKPKGVIVFIEGEHLCMQMRGIEKEDSFFTSSCVKGIFKKEKGMEEKFYKIIEPRRWR